MKFPNGFGSITKLSGNRRRPYAVRISINGHQKYLSFHETYEAAFSSLLEYNQNPTAIASSTLTFENVFRLEMDGHRKRIAVVTAKNYEVAFRQCRKLWKKPFFSISVSDLQGVISDLSKRGVGNPAQKKVRQLFHNLYTYAIKYQIVPPSADMSRFVDVDMPKRKTVKKPFNRRQLNRIRAIADSDEPLAPWAKCAVMLCFCGARPSEFLAIRKSDVHIKSRYFVIRESKTAAGRNRIVPINKKVLPYYEYWMSQPGRNLIVIDTEPVTYTQFRRLFAKVMEAGRCSHLPHECRHTCATWLDEKGANPLSIKRILGHAVRDVTAGVYTHKSIRELRKAIDLL